MRSLIAITIVLCAGLWAEGARAQPSEYRLGPGDKLRIAMPGRDPAAIVAVIDADGRIQVSPLGLVVAANRIVGELRAALAAALAKAAPAPRQISVEVLLFRPFTIEGAVNAPRAYGYLSGMTVGNAIDMAGGYADGAKRQPVLLIRRDANGAPVRYQAFADTPLFPGDRLIVAREE